MHGDRIDDAEEAEATETASDHDEDERWAWPPNEGELLTPRAATLRVMQQTVRALPT
jgi:hypothetical protein